MSNLLSRRKLITTGLTAAAGAAGLAVAERVAGKYGLLPPDESGIWGPGETLTYATQRLLMSYHSMAREFSRSEVSKVHPISGYPPQSDPYQRLLHGGFKEWRLPVDGLVERPASFSLDDLKRLPGCSQITEQACEEGWSFIAEWHGTRLSNILQQVGMSARARYVVFFSYDIVWDSLDLPDAYHPQTMLAYGLGGNELPVDYGAPVRLRVARQLGYKSVKYLSRITVTDSLKNIKNGLGSISPDYGYTWYAGI
jgi:DMSO/TMAO reductase YedYZ molybdopterin-dependent catalytic subunit